MNFEAIIRLLQDHPQSEDWSRARWGDKVVAYCREDVNLHLELQSDRSDHIPVFYLDVWYANTLLDRVRLGSDATAKGEIPLDSLLQEVLSALIDKLTDGE